MRYAPEGMLVWDAWCLEREGLFHLYFLQRDCAEDRKSSAQEELGHAVSRDLVYWETRPNALAPDPENSDDDLQPWTGCAINAPDGDVYLYYTMRGSRTFGREQAIGLARSSDGECFKRFAGNPVVRAPNSPIPGMSDCRDLCVIPAPDGDGFLGYYAARRQAETLCETSAIFVAFSRDLLHWEDRGAVFFGGPFACVEVPDVFELEGRWFLTMLTGNVYGGRGALPDAMTGATVYAQSDSPYGPFRLPDDFVLLGARSASPISVRSIAKDDARLALYTDRIRQNPEFLDSRLRVGFLSTPKRYTLRNGRLALLYWPLPFKEAAAPFPLAMEKTWGQIWGMKDAHWVWGEVEISGQCADRWSVLPLAGDWGDFFMLECELESSAAAAGFVVHRQENVPNIWPHERGLGFFVEPEAGRVMAADLPFLEFTEIRTADVCSRGRMHLRLIRRGVALEFYVEDVLLLAFTYAKGTTGAIGLAVDRGAACFRKLRVSRV